MRIIQWGMIIGLLFVASVQAEFTMLRCDNGKVDFLSSPSQIQLGECQQKFDPSVDTVVLVHGFNTSYDSAKSSFQFTTQVLQGVLGKRNYVGFHWPSNTLIDFGQAVENANKTGPYLAHVLSQITSWYGSSNKKIHLITHSLGGRVLLSTLSENTARYFKIGKCFSMAPAVHCNIYTTSFKGTNLVPEQTWVYYSGGDWVLKYLYALYYWLFDRNANVFATDPEYQRFMALSLEEKFAYMKKLEQEQQQRQPEFSPFEQSLLAAIAEADEKAMGLIGCNPKVAKVSDINVTDIIEGHTYWTNGEVVKRIAQKMQ